MLLFQRETKQNTKMEVNRFFANQVHQAWEENQRFTASLWCSNEHSSSWCVRGCEVLVQVLVQVLVWYSPCGSCGLWPTASKPDQTDEHRAAVHIRCGSRRRAGCFLWCCHWEKPHTSQVFGCSTSLVGTSRVSPEPDSRNAANDGVKENGSLAKCLWAQWWRCEPSLL